VSKHSPLPWRKGNVSSIVSDGTPDGQPPNPEQFQNFYGGQPVCVAMFETDADLVLQAVNSHADLLEACEHALELMQMATVDNGVYSPSGQSEGEHWRQLCMKELQEAIAKAKPEST